MNLLEPIKFAIRKIEYLPFFQRAFAVYKKPDFDSYPSSVFQHELIDLVISLILSDLVVFAILQIFPSYFVFDPFKVFYIVPLTIQFILNALLISILIGLFATIVFFILNKKLNLNLFKLVLWRSVRLFSIINFFVILIALESFNDMFKFGFIQSKGLIIDFSMIFVLIGLPLFVGFKILVDPLINII